MDALITQKEELLHSSIENRIKRYQVNTAPPNDFREMSTFPTADEIHNKEKAYLRPLIKVGSYNDEEHYLDIQFRLLKEDVVSPLRDGVREIMTRMKREDQNISLKVYNGVKLLWSRCTDDGYISRLHFHTAKTKRIPWKQSKRLKSGSLVCLSANNFRTVLFATIHEHGQRDLEKGFLIVYFEYPAAAEEYYRQNGVMQMVECPSYFLPYRHVLNAMKRITIVPFSQYLIKCDNDTNRPQYLRDGTDFTYELRRISNQPMVKGIRRGIRYRGANTWRIPILKDDQWPPFTETNLNLSQFKAFMHAITNEFAVIQGPPGTGKTHVALRIADVLIENKTFWNNDKQSPMLIVCYTNHALDQFLKGLIEFGHRNIIRVGGRASEDLLKYNLRTVKKYKGYRRSQVTDGGECPYIARERAANEVSICVKYLEGIHNSVGTGNLLDFNLLIHVMLDLHRAFLIFWYWKCFELNVPLFHVFLGLLPITLEQLMSVQVIEQQFYEPSQIKGEDGQYYTTFTMLCNGVKIVQPTAEEISIRVLDHFKNDKAMSEDEATSVVDPSFLSFRNRWRLYRYWVDKYVAMCTSFKEDNVKIHKEACERVRELREQNDEFILKEADVIAMTTTGAASHQRSLSNIKPKIVIIEEAAEVLEAHVLTSLTEGLEHLILIGDHKQLKPNPTVYKLAKKYSLDLSLFERMVNNGMQCHTLDIQHRMRPEIARLVRHIYPDLRNHESVNNYGNVMGVQKDLLFINHSHPEKMVEHLKSKSNTHEAEFIKGLTRYFIKQGYRPDQITVLTTYTGQVIKIKEKMPLSEFEGIRITAVDNFQGEENDIILLSLVRSNSDGKIGFLKTENRICVALSRAKVGFFVIGNFDLLEKESPLWKKIIDDMRHSDSIKDHLPLQCQNHPETVVHVKNGEDFSCAPEGGCKKPCEFRLDCGHVCRLLCHPVDQDHMKYICEKKCLKDTGCDLDHKCNFTCHYGSECGPCSNLMKKTIPDCGHTQEMKCHKDPEEFQCKFRCSRVLECGHTQEMKCYEDPRKYVCKKKCLKDTGCKLDHKCNFTCHYGSECGPCSNLMKKTIPDCGHTQEMKCHKDPEEFQCEFRCSRVLECGHTREMKCYEDPEEFQCEEKCPSIRVCGHKCKRRCGEVCDEFPCDKILKKTMPDCGHTQEMKCYEDTEEFQCETKCPRVRECGHKCMQSCGKVCEDFPCNIKVTIVQEPCGDKQRIRCSEDIKDIRCKTKCQKQLGCLHQCVGTCSNCNQGRLHVKCAHTCDRVLVCSHRCTAPCISDCPPCKKRCENSCIHNKCKELCGKVCTPCSEPCEWKCEHLKCEKKCFEVCERERCNEPCQKELRCGHKCIGLCGEICPSFCRVCHKDIVQKCFLGEKEDEVDTRFLVLSDCRHMFEVSGLDKWMEDVEDGGVKLKECPKCKTPVRKSLRYRNIIKSVLLDIEQIKQNVIDRNAKVNDIKSEGYLECKKIWAETQRLNPAGFPTEQELRQCRDFAPYFKGKRPCVRMVARLFSTDNMSDATRYLNQISQLKNLTALKSTLKHHELQEIFASENMEFSKLINQLESYFFQILSEYQFQQGLIEFQRVILFINTCEIKCNLKRILSETNQGQLKDVNEYINNLIADLERGKPLSKAPEKENELLKEIQQVLRFGELTDVENKKVVKVIDGKGHWYKCPNDHFYFVGLSAGVSGKGACPECTAGGEDFDCSD